MEREGEMLILMVVIWLPPVDLVCLAPVAPVKQLEGGRGEITGKNKSSNAHLVKTRQSVYNCAKEKYDMTTMTIFSLYQNIQRA